MAWLGFGSRYLGNPKGMLRNIFRGREDSGFHNILTDPILSLY
jgi:hypothetical protein